MTNGSKISVFFAFQFHKAAISKTDREFALVEAIKQAQSEIQQTHPDCYLEWKEGMPFDIITLTDFP